MIIKNNYNNKDVNPLDDYISVGKGRNSLDREIKKEKEGFIKENMSDPILKDLRGENVLIEDEKEEDKWDFFK